MKWKTILKAPMPLNSRETRDENYKQAIIAYEKDTIEPKLTEFIRSRPALEKEEIIIAFLDDSSFHESVVELTSGSIRFAIHLPSVPELGKNMYYIVDTIGKLYADEGYIVDTKSKNANNPAVYIEQPN